MSLQEEVSAGVANAGGPIVDHLVFSVTKEIRQTGRDVLKALSGKKVHIECDITFPDLTK